MRRIKTFIWATALTTSVVGGTTLAAWAASGGGGAATQPASTSTKQKVVIRFWNWWDTYRKEWMDEVIRRFEAEYPWIDVRNEVQGWADRSAKVMAAYAAGAPAEITMALRQEIAALSDMGAIIPITQFVQRDKMDLKEFFAAEVQAFIWDDELWSLPLPSVSGEGSMYFYNKSLFEEAGLDPDHPPVTWRTFQQAAKKLTRADAQGRLTQLAIDTHPPMVVHMTYANAGQIITDDRRRAVFDSQQAIDALKFVAIDLNQKALGGPAHRCLPGRYDSSRSLCPGQAGDDQRAPQRHRRDPGPSAQELQLGRNAGSLQRKQPQLEVAGHRRLPVGVGIRHTERIVAGEARGCLALPQIPDRR